MRAASNPSRRKVRQTPPAERPYIWRLWGLLVAGTTALGPGLVTGAADDDPSGIATYSQIGAQFGFAMLWTLVLTYPLMAAIQEVSAWIGRVTGAGLAKNMKLHYPLWVSYSVLALLLFANVINLAADIAAMAAALCLIVGGPSLVYSVLFGAVCLSAEIVVPYARFAQVLKWAALVLFVYVATAFVIHIPLRAVLMGTFVPSIKFSGGYLTALTAVLGTTISPYLFFWQASQEVQEQQAAPTEKPLRRAPEQGPAQLHTMRADTYLGMALSNSIAFFIMLDTGSLLHPHGITDIQTAAQAASALRPLAGEFAFLLFSIGIIGTGLLAIPVLAGSLGYAMAEIRNWPIGLDRSLPRARRFYAAIAAVTILGVALNFTSMNPIKALYWSAVINGLSAGPIMIVMMLMTTNPKVTGGVQLPKPQWVIGWISTAVMLAVAAAMIIGVAF
jgi:NRAMP (natural resistance-associated macrophage protein)-like metal ion transporter